MKFQAHQKDVKARMDFHLDPPVMLEQYKNLLDMLATDNFVTDNGEFEIKNVRDVEILTYTGQVVYVVIRFTCDLGEQRG